MFYESKKILLIATELQTNKRFLCIDVTTGNMEIKQDTSCLVRYHPSPNSPIIQRIAVIALHDDIKIRLDVSQKLIGAFERCSESIKNNLNKVNIQNTLNANKKDEPQKTNTTVKLSEQQMQLGLN